VVVVAVVVVVVVVVRRRLLRLSSAAAVAVAMTTTTTTTTTTTFFLVHTKSSQLNQQNKTTKQNNKNYVQGASSKQARRSSKQASRGGGRHARARRPLEGPRRERKGTTEPFKKRPVGTRKGGPNPRQRKLQQGKIRDWGPNGNFTNEREPLDGSDKLGSYLETLNSIANPKGAKRGNPTFRARVEIILQFRMKKLGDFTEGKLCLFKSGLGTMPLANVPHVGSSNEVKRKLDP